MSVCILQEQVQATPWQASCCPSTKDLRASPLPICVHGAQGIAQPVLLGGSRARRTYSEKEAGSEHRGQTDVPLPQRRFRCREPSDSRSLAPDYNGATLRNGPQRGINE